MHVVGIVAEYNPFHAGHRWQIDALRSRLGADTAVVAVMSGNWVQRGDAAITDKWARSRMALEGGADLVLELPTVWAASSAESFARARSPCCTPPAWWTRCASEVRAATWRPSPLWPAVWTARASRRSCAALPAGAHPLPPPARP